MDYHKLRYVTRLLQLAAEEREVQWLEMQKATAALAETGQLDEAELSYKRLLAESSKNSVWWYDLARVHDKQGRFIDAVTALLRSLELDPSSVERHHYLGTLLRHLSDPGLEVQRYLEGLKSGHQLIVQHRIREAINAYESDYQLLPEDITLARTLAEALRMAGDDGRASLLLGHAYYHAASYTSAIDEFTSALTAGSIDVAAYGEWADALNKKRRYAEAIDICKAGLQRYPKEGGIYRKLVWALGELNQVHDVIAAAEAAGTETSSPLLLATARHLSLPIVYEDADQIRHWRLRFTEGLRRLVRETRLDTPEAVTLAREDIHPNFYLGYQCLNDMPLQREYGNLTHRIMRASYPAWADGRAMPSLDGNGRIRIGYIFSGHTGIDPLFVAWMTEHDSARFEVIAYQVGGTVEPALHHLRLAVATFHHLPDDLESLCRLVVEDRLHLLVFLYIGMGSLWSQLAALRLAPVQCATWGHPITTGLPTIDYFISNELMEPGNADEHYSETLVRLPSLGVSPAPPFLPPLAKARRDFGLPDEATIYISPQSPAKYLPQYDHVFPAIARRVPDALIVLIEPHAPAVGSLLRSRFQAAFAKAGLDSDRFMRFLPNQPYSDYLDLIRRCDVFLDTIGWSGGLTTLDAVRSGLPVVTHPGELMRGRQSAGILRQMDMGETIATSLDDYVDIAVRLGLDADWRRQISEQLQERQHRVFDDRSWLPALEEFYRRAVTNDALTVRTPSTRIPHQRTI